MSPIEETVVAMTNRSLRTIRTELEYLTDASVITPQQLSSILAQLPSQTALHAPLTTPGTNDIPVVAPTASAVPNIAALNLNGSHSEKQDYSHSSAPSPAPGPPAYAQTLARPSPLTFATALYAYNPTDAGDVALMPNDRIAVLEYTNAEWWKGSNERTGLEGIFPRAYVRVEEDTLPQKSTASASSYGNMPLDVSQSNSTPAEPGKPSAGKKFGKKLGNAAIFGAGATIGSNIVNGIL